MNTPVFGLALLLFLLLVAGAACRDDDEGTNEADDRHTLELMATDIDKFIGEPQCSGVDDCRVIAFGAKPCGGPWSYKVYSTASSDSVALADMVQRYNAFNAELNDRYGWISDCMVVEAPDIECVKGVCQAVPTAKTPVR